MCFICKLEISNDQDSTQRHVDLGPAVLEPGNITAVIRAHDACLLALTEILESM